MARIKQVRRADGTLVPFRERKIADAIARALTDAGAPDRPLAYELAGVVSLFLAKHFDDAAPSTGDVRTVLGRVLRETGHEHAARRFEASLAARERLERDLTVRYPCGDEEGPRNREGTEELAPWSRTRMIAGLMRTREIPEAVAEDVVTAIEERLIRCGYQSVTRGFLAEMIDHEFLEQGLEGARVPDLAYSVRRSLVRRLAAPDAESDVPPIERGISGAVLRAHAMSDVHAGSVVDAHRTGRIYVHGLDEPFKVERLVMPVLAAVPDFFEDPVRGLIRMRGHLDALRSHVRSAIEIPDLVGGLAATPLAREDTERAVALVLEALDFRDAFARPGPPVIHLSIPFGAGPERAGGKGFLQALVTALTSGVSRTAGFTVSLCLLGEDSDDDLISEAIAIAARRPGTFVKLAREDDPPLFPDLYRAPVPLRLSLGRVSINLPLALADVEQGGLNEALAAIDASGNEALNALRERFWLQREGRPHGLHGIVVRLGGPGRVQVQADGQEVDVDLWGLVPALALLERRGVISHARLTDAAARILGYVDYLVGAERDGIRFRVRLGGTAHRAVRRALFEATRTWAERYVIEDLDEVLRTTDHEGGNLPVAVPLLSDRNAPLLDASFAERLGPGLALSLSALEEGAGPETFRRIHADSRLGLLELAPPRPSDDLFEVQEELF